MLQDEPLGERFPASSRLLHRSEFKAVQERGLRYAGTALVLFAQENARGRRRLGVTVSRRVGNSVVRSRVKRCLREIFRKRRDALPPSIDVVVIARPCAADRSFQQLAEEFERAASGLERLFAQQKSRAGRAPARRS